MSNPIESNLRITTYCCTTWKVKAGNILSLTETEARPPCEFIYCSCTQCQLFCKDALTWQPGVCQAVVGCKFPRCRRRYDSTRHWDSKRVAGAQLCMDVAEFNVSQSRVRGSPDSTRKVDQLVPLSPAPTGMASTPWAIYWAAIDKPQCVAGHLARSRSNCATVSGAIFSKKPPTSSTAHRIGALVATSADQSHTSGGYHYGSLGTCILSSRASMRRGTAPGWFR